jgi:death-on-curing protein
LGSFKVKSSGCNIETIDACEIINLHHLISNHPESLADPILPKGIKNEGMLESAVFRQEVGSGDVYKYDNIHSNCATLLFGITKNHSFHNGNKRAAFLSMLLHLFKNGKTLDPNVKHADIYNVLKKLASTEDEFETFVKSKFRRIYRGLKKRHKNWDDEASVFFLEHWIKRNSISKNQIKRSLKWNNFFGKLKSFELEVSEPNTSNQTFRVSKTTKKKGFIFNSTNQISFTYPYRGDVCKVSLISKVRNDFELTKKEGIDNSVFFNTDIYIDEVLTQYKQLIYKLSLT